MSGYTIGTIWTDYMHGTPLHDWFFGREGDDRLFGYGGDDWLVGEDGHDRFWGGEGDDIMSGGRGNDRFHGDEGADIMYGGVGFDWVDYSKSTKWVTVDLQRGFGKYGDAEGDTYHSIENAVGSDFTDELYGSDANNRLYGRDGNDWLHGSLGADYMNGGNGIDIANYLKSNAGITVNLHDGIYRGGHAEGDRLHHIENVYGGKFNDEITGTNGDNRLWGYDGDDEIHGLKGDDEIHGDKGDDTLFGNEGEDYLSGGDGRDKIYGGDGDDTFRGGDERDDMFGGDGDDVFYGDGGHDVMTGGRGADHFDGGAGDDAVKYGFDQHGNDLTNAEGVWVDLSIGRGFYGHAQGDTYKSVQDVHGTIASDTLIGNAQDNYLSGGSGKGNDYLKGLAGDDFLVGWGGNDILEGGRGADTLEGWGGSDTFVYKQASDSTHGAMDKIGGWDDQWTPGRGREYDKFDFRQLDADQFTAGNQALKWIGENAYSDIGQIKEIRAGGATYVEVNLDHDVTDSEMIIKIAVPVDLQQDDFVL